MLREIIVKIELNQEEDEEEIIVKVLLDSEVTRLVISLEFVRKNKFRKKKLNRPIYVRNIDNVFNYKGPIKHIVKIEKEHKEIIEI